MRAAGAIGAPLEAEVTIFAPAAQAGRFQALRDELRFLLITSQARVVETDTRPPQRFRPANPACGSRSNPVRSLNACVLAPAQRCRQRSAAPGTVCALRHQRRGSR